MVPNPETKHPDPKNMVQVDGSNDGVCDRENIFIIEFYNFHVFARIAGISEG